MNKISLIALVVFLSACASMGNKSPLQLDDAGVNPEFQRGMRALEKEDFASAADIFDRLLVAKPAAEADLVTLYNSGAAYEGLGQCEKASERYREVMRSSAGKFARIEAQAAFRLSLTFECMGDDNKAVAALLDAKRRAQVLPVEVARAELPARLAAAYARLGNRDQAKQYFSQASDGLKIVLAAGTTARAQKETLARTLFYMGQLNPAQRVAGVDPQAFLQSLSMQQPYLLQAVEMNINPWSRKAADDLANAFDNMTRFRLDDQKSRTEFYTHCLQVIAELRRIRLPDAGAREDQIFAKVDRTERRIRDELASLPPSMPLTPDAQKRDGLRREGRPVDPRSSALPKRGTRASR